MSIVRGFHQTFRARKRRVSLKALQLGQNSIPFAKLMGSNPMEIGFKWKGGVREDSL